jgi:hypothetical protein
MSCSGERKTLFRTIKKLTCKAFGVTFISKETPVACTVGRVAE